MRQFRDAKKSHPDVDTDNPKAAENFKEINAAYHILFDKDTRTRYDNMRKIYRGKAIYVDSLSNCDYGLIKGI